MNDQQFQVLTNILGRIANALEKIAESNGKVTNPQDRNDETIFFPAKSLVPEMLDGELYWRIKGSQFHKHGGRVNLDVLEQAGFTVLEIKKQQLRGWMAHAVLNDSRDPEKVVWLESFPMPDLDTPAKEPQRVPVEESTDGGELQPAAPKDYTTYWTKVVPHFELCKEEAKKLLIDCNQDAIRAYQKLVGLGDRGVLK